MGVPVPKVLLWSSVSTNAVGSEYIITEKAKGTVLSECWCSLDRDAKNRIIEQVVDLELLLASRSFAAHGSLFYQKDVPVESVPLTSVDGGTAHELAIGPLVHPALWEDVRERLPVHKGPCKLYLLDHFRVLS